MKVAVFLFGIMLLYACRSNQQPPVLSEEEVKEHMMQANRILVNREADDIREYITRHGWHMQKSGTGLNCEVYEHGNGPKAEPGNIVSIVYTLHLIDGTFCYEADANKPLTFMLGKSQQPRGLEEGILQMAVGSKARLVVPAHLGYGTIGDDNKVPGNSALVYNVTLVKIDHEKL
jgi:FKBP-type peptidyl-prolyl cis-trans isomerase